LTSHANKDNGKPTESVKYLLEYNDGTSRKTTVLPEHAQALQETIFTPAQTMQHIDTMWHSRHVKLDADLRSLLKPRLENYQMSPTHLNTFIDTEYGGPEQFLLNTLLRFPSAPGEDGEFGNAVHAALEKLQNAESKSEANLLKFFDASLKQRYISPERMDDFRNKGHNALKKYLAARTDMFAASAKPEVDFKREGVLVGEAHLAGKIDRLEIDTENKTVNIVDFKTGKPHSKWDREVKLLKYKQQLYFYKFLIEGSHTWSGYKVKEARLEFVEPDSEGNILPPLQISFDAEDKSATALTTEQETKDLIQAVWAHIKSLDLTDITSYSDDYKGSRNFIEELLS
jgi:RecB family exonuclease